MHIMMSHFVVRLLPNMLRRPAILLQLCNRQQRQHACHHWASHQQPGLGSSTTAAAAPHKEQLGAMESS
jgi:hypothetical protein